MGDKSNLDNDVFKMIIFGADMGLGAGDDISGKQPTGDSRAAEDGESRPKNQMGGIKA
jgi:hypothetical protein